MTSNCMPHKECCHTGENITDTGPVRVRQIIDPDSGIHVSMGQPAQIGSYAGQSKGARQ